MSNVSTAANNVPETPSNKTRVFAPEWLVWAITLCKVLAALSPRAALAMTRQIPMANAKLTNPMTSPMMLRRLTVIETQAGQPPIGSTGLYPRDPDDTIMHAEGFIERVTEPRYDIAFGC